MSFCGWLWRVLPGPSIVRVLQLIVLAGLVIAVLFVWVFPAIAPLMPFNQTTVDQ